MRQGYWGGKPWWWRWNELWRFGGADDDDDNYDDDDKDDDVDVDHTYQT